MEGWVGMGLKLHRSKEFLWKPPSDRPRNQKEEGHHYTCSLLPAHDKSCPILQLVSGELVPVPTLCSLAKRVGRHVWLQSWLYLQNIRGLRTGGRQ